MNILLDYCHTKFGISYQEDPYLQYDAKTSTISAPSITMFIHELCHWLVSSPRERLQDNYGLVHHSAHASNQEDKARIYENYLHSRTQSRLVQDVPMYRAETRSEMRIIDKVSQKLQREFGYSTETELVQRIKSLPQNTVFVNQFAGFGQ